MRLFFLTELMLSEAMGFGGDDIMFSSNVTPAEEYRKAAELNAVINLDDITHVDFLEETLGYIPKKISCRYNPGGLFKITTDIMDNPGDAKYGMTTEQLFEAFRMLKAKGRRNSASTRFWPAIRLPMNIIRLWPGFCSRLQSDCRRRRAVILRLLICPAVSGSPIDRSRRRMISWPSARASVKFMRRF